MDYSKAIFLFALLFAATVSARQLTESTTVVETQSVEDSKYYCRFGGHCSGHYGHGGYGGHYPPKEEENKEKDIDPQHYGGGYGGYGHGGYGHGGYGHGGYGHGGYGHGGYGHGGYGGHYPPKEEGKATASVEKGN